MAFGFDDAIAAGLHILDKFIPDPELRAKAEREFRESFMGLDKAQMAVNATEAATGSLYNGGWRPAIGWTCAIALFYQYILVPWLLWASFALDLQIPAPPTLDKVLWELVFGLLGMSSIRMVEKLSGVAKP